ncbi:carboxymuconolactone decarboxylase family protein [Rhodopila globiformis]|uniref:carboxymuconolactone decarboxylase family protein n=1 Tax=Rhodopila globiformis TaxID=1071 RepID=UPI0011B01375|nr:carboxymuconolactone decarboxylase family protein [Rhodopila globiformis]
MRLDHQRAVCCYTGVEPERAVISDKGLLSAEDEARLQATLRRIAETHGYVSNLMQTVALAPDGLAAFAALAAYTRHGSQLTERQKQLAILIASRDVHYGWAHHAPQARAEGVTEDQLQRLREGRTPRDLTASEQALCEYAFEIAYGRRLPLRVADQMHGHFSPRQIVDLALLIAHAMSVAALALGLDVPLEAPEVLRFELEWQQRRAAG